MIFKRVATIVNSQGQTTAIQYDEVPTWEYIIDLRDKVLQLTDWTQMPDVPISDAERMYWKGYRQQLRDIRQTFAEPKDVVFPLPSDRLDGFAEITDGKI